MQLYLDNEIKSYFSPNQDLFTQFMQLRGERFRHLDGRSTQRIVIGNKTFFIKQHTGVGWKEICKNLLQGRLPVLGARNEWLAIEKLRGLGVPVPKVVAYGERGMNPARRQSFILMEELTPTMSLEDMVKTWMTQPPAFAFKRKLITEVARIASIVHRNGINHRDFYICHFLLDISAGLANINPHKMKVSLIDLHRAQIRRLTPERWIVKDLGGLYFSSMGIGLTKRDLYRFMVLYRAQSLKKILALENEFWQKVKVRGEQLYRNHS